MKDILGKIAASVKTTNGFDSKRNYIGLSSIGDPVEKIIEKYYQEPQTQDHLSAMKTWVSYGIEALLLDQILKIGGSKGEEISICDGLIKGHTDGSIGNILIEIKSVANADHFPDSKLPYKVFWQIQGYLKFLPKYEHCICLYIARDSGLINSYKQLRVQSIQDQIEEKIKTIIKQIQ